MVPEHKTQVTVRDGEAALASALLREEAKTFVLEVPRRKRYTLPLDLDAEVPAEREQNAPAALLDI